MTNKEKIKIIEDYLDSLFPNAGCELFYNKDYELAIAVLLSAQTTDKSVNLVTKELFKKYASVDALADANISDVETIIKSIGLYKNKARNVVGLAKVLKTKFNGELPFDKNELQCLPGIGNKSAGVIRAEIFKIPDLAVDTHILRLSKRFGFVKDGATPLETEIKLKSLIEKEKWIKTHHQFIHFGRYFCKAISPMCEQCKLHEICKKYQQK